MNPGKDMDFIVMTVELRFQTLASVRTLKEGFLLEAVIDPYFHFFKKQLGFWKKSP
jgi:hypothetical protein